jgi:two-component system, OmpR family, copper resistance phosphate regulon response regulator CusR
MNNILIVEDEQRVAEILQKQLTDSGFNVEIAYDGYIGKQLTEKNNYILIILDISLPLINGYDLCKEIRKANSNVPIIMLTAFGTTDNIVAGFDVGADDYVVKPFDFRELLARIYALIRRSDATKPADKLKIADLEMNLKTKSVTRGDRKIELTSKESLLLETFLKNRDKVLSRDFIMEQVWEIEFDPKTNIIDVYVNYLRNKIDKYFEPKLIHTKHGFGFYCSEYEL